MFLSWLYILHLPACFLLQGDGRFDPVRALLAAAPTAGQPRDNFARNLVRAHCCWLPWDAFHAFLSAMCWAGQCLMRQ